MRDIIGMIEPPFANYHRAKLERLVREGFEEIERRAAKNPDYSGFGDVPQPMNSRDFQVLVAADYYLRSTR